MFPWHSSDLNAWHPFCIISLCCLPRPALCARHNVHQHTVKEIEFMDVAESLTRLFACKVGFGVWSGDDREITAQGSLDFLVEVVGMVVGEKDYIDVREVVQVDSRFSLADACHAGAEMDMITSVEEVGL